MPKNPKCIYIWGGEIGFGIVFAIKYKPKNKEKTMFNNSFYGGGGIIILRLNSL